MARCRSWRISMRRAWTSWRSAWDRVVMDSVRRASSQSTVATGSGASVREAGAGVAARSPGGVPEGPPVAVAGECTASISAASSAAGAEGWPSPRTWTGAWTPASARRRVVTSTVSDNASALHVSARPARATARGRREATPRATSTSSGRTGQTASTTTTAASGRSEGEASTAMRISPGSPAASRAGPRAASPAAASRAAATAGAAESRAPNTAIVSGPGRFRAWGAFCGRGAFCG